MSLEGKKTDSQTLTGDIGVKPGINGKSVTIVKITESTEDGGNNIVEFSDGSRLKIKNGSGGKIGIDGKSAYQYAQDGGYTGTEEEFALLMSQENLQTEKVDKISIEVSKLSEEKANRIVETASGETIVVTDSDEKKPLGLAIDGKSEQNQYSGNQLFKFKKDLNALISGVTIKDNGDGTLYISGLTTQTDGMFILGNAFVGTDIVLSLKAGTYYVSGLPSGIMFFLYKANTETIVSIKTETDGAFTLEEDTDFVSISLRWYGGKTVNSPVTKIMFSTTTLPWEPYCGGIPSPNPSYPQEIRNIGVYDEASGKYAVEVKLAKKNKLKNIGNNQETKGVTITVNEDGIITCNGTATGDIYTTIARNLPKVGKCILSGCPSGGGSSSYELSFKHDKTLRDYGNGVEIDLSGDISTATVQIAIRSGVTVSNLTFEPMIRPVGTDSTYEPWQETTATVLLDEPLRKGDEAYWNGGSKVRVERYRAVEVFDGSEDEGWTESANSEKTIYRCRSNKLSSLIEKQVNPANISDLLCDSLIASSQNLTYLGNSGIAVDSGGTLCVFEPNYNTSDISLWKAHLVENPITVEYKLATPITEEIDLSLDGLSMFYPTTILSNDCNANMEVEYIADTKAYVDKKITEVITAML